MSTLLVGRVTARSSRGARRALLWVGSVGPLVVPEPDALDDVRRGTEVRVVYHAEVDGTLVVDVLLPIAAVGPWARPDRVRLVPAVV